MFDIPPQTATAAVDEAGKTILPPVLGEVDKLIAALQSLFDGYTVTITISKKGPQ